MDICSGLKEKVIHYVEIVRADIPHPDGMPRGGPEGRGEWGVNRPAAAGRGQRGRGASPEEKEEWR